MEIEILLLATSNQTTFSNSPRVTITKIYLKIYLIERSPEGKWRWHRRKERTFHCNVVHRIHRTSDRRERMALLRHVCQYHRVVIERNVLKLQQCNFAGLRTPHDQHPKVKEMENKIVWILISNVWNVSSYEGHMSNDGIKYLLLDISIQDLYQCQHSIRSHTNDPLSWQVPLMIQPTATCHEQA